LSEQLGLDERDLSRLSRFTQDKLGSAIEQSSQAEQKQKAQSLEAQGNSPAISTSSKTAAPEEQSKHQVMEHLSHLNSDVLQGVTDRAKTLFGQLDESLKQSIEASSNLLPSPGHPLQYLRDRLPSLSDSLVSRLADLPEYSSEQIQDWLEETQGQLSEQIDQAQTALESSLQALQQQAMEQAEQVRHWAAVAAWWLFGLTLSSAIAAGAAGYLAILSPQLQNFP